MITRNYAIAGFVATAVALSMGLANAQNRPQLKIGTEGAYAPFSYVTADGELKGFDIDIARALCEEMDAECEFVMQDWDGIIPALQAGRFDVIIASMAITEERKQQVDFTEKYYNTPPAIAIPVNSDIAGVSREDLAGKVIGAQASTTHANFAEATFTDSTIQLYPTAEEYQMDMVNGRLDAVIDDIIVLDQWLHTDSGECCQILDSITPPEDIYGEGIGIALRQGEDDLREKLNAAIKAIRENGKYKEINDKYFSVDVYGE